MATPLPGSRPGQSPVRSEWDDESHLRLLLENMPALIWTTDADLRITSVHGAILETLDLRPDEILGRHISEVALPGSGATLAYDRGLHGKSVRFEEGFGTRSFEINVEPLRGDKGVVLGCMAVALDITESKDRLDKVLRLSRIHVVLNSINSLIVRVRNRVELFREVSRVVVNQGGFMLAWIGVLEGDGIRPVAYYGDNSFLEDPRVSRRDGSTQDLGPIGQAMRENRLVVSNDIAADSAIHPPVREALIESGCRSLLIQPLVVGGRSVACLILNSNEVNFFDDEEIKLLAGLAGNIAYAMEFITREEHLDYLAYYDTLTGLANRRLFSERLGQLVQTARQDRTRLAVLILDIERFKSVNDALGIAAGDEVLRIAGQRLLQFVGNANYLARITGDRFAAVIPKLEEAADLAVILQERIWKPLAAPFEINGQELRLTVKTGIAVFPEDGDTAESLIGNAEAAMKKAKDSAERYLFYTQHMGKAISERLSLESRLRKAIERDEFILYYQPKIELRGGSIKGVEALIRWNSPDLGLVPPQQFIPLLEETGLILEVGDWALKRAVSDSRQWIAQGLQAPRIAVNVSAIQLAHPGFLNSVKEAIKGQPAGDPGIDIEVTESMLMTDVESSIRKLEEIRQLGMEISIDDFGTGYSSLSYLAKLPVNMVKIDRSFIVVMTESSEKMSIVSTIITLAHSMSLKVIAEGVDSLEQLKFLRLLRCDEIQGYLFSKPLPPDELFTLVREGRRLV